MNLMKWRSDCMRKISKNEEKEYDELINEDDDKWDKKELGADPKHTRRAPEHLQISKSTSIRLPDHMIEALKKRATEEGMPYQTLIKHIITKFLKSAS